MILVSQGPAHEMQVVYLIDRMNFGKVGPQRFRFCNPLFRRLPNRLSKSQFCKHIVLRIYLEILEIILLFKKII